MDVAGVAAATSIANIISMILTLRTLMKSSSMCRFSLRKLKIELPTLWRLLKIAIPSAVQGSCFSLSNMTIQSAINSFGSLAVAGAATSQIFEAIIYVVCFSLNLTATSFVAQNYGAAKPERIKKSIGSAILQVLMVGITLQALILIFSREFANLFIDANDANKEAVISIVLDVLKVTVIFYFMCGIMETLSGALRGLGYSMAPMLMSVGGICGFRILWIFTAFKHPSLHSITGLYRCYPISWSLTVLMLGTTLLIIWPKVKAHFSKN
jgi:Na+-driven multidrug efflux pump